MVIGVGAHKSGTVSLANTFGVWHEFKTLHNKFFSEDPENWLNRMELMSREFGKQPGDVGFDHINNIDYFLENGHTVIGIIRQPAECISSMNRRGLHRPLQRIFPDHDFTSVHGLTEFYDWFNDKLLASGIPVIGVESLERHDNKWEEYQHNEQEKYDETEHQRFSKDFYDFTKEE